MRVQYQLFLSVQQPKMQCCVAAKDSEAVSHISKVHDLLHKEHEKEGENLLEYLTAWCKVTGDKDPSRHVREN